MSVEATRWAAKQRTKGASRKAVLMALADFSDAQGICWPSQAKLADYLQLTDRTVRAALADLEAQGIIMRFSKRNADGTRGLDKIQVCLTEELREIAASRSQRKGFPVEQPPENNGRTTGKTQQNHRKSTTQPPETVSGQEPPREPLEGNHHSNHSEAIASGGGAAVAVIERPIADVIWTDGVVALTALGESEKSARTLVGQLRKQAGNDDDRVWWAIQQAAAVRTGDPRTYCLRLLLPKTERPASKGRRAGMVGVLMADYGGLH